MNSNTQEAAPTIASPASSSVAIIGGGPAGLMAAEMLASKGVSVDLYDAMPSVGRKFLLAGRGGLNLTHSEDLPTFMTRFAERQEELAAPVAAFTPTDMREEAKALGIETFIGTSGRVFPTDMKAAPLLRAWLHRLRQAGVRFHMRHRWQGWTADGALQFSTPKGEVQQRAQATVLALGGASWARLGSDGAWVERLAQVGATVAALRPANCGFDVAATGPQRTGWSDHLRERFAGQPIKPVVIEHREADGKVTRQQGEFVLTDTGVEGSLIYAFSARIRKQIEATVQATIYLDLLPSHSPQQVLAETSRAKGPRSLSTHLKSRLGIHGIKMALLHELLSQAELNSPATLAERLKALPVTLSKARPIDEAISTAGGVTFESMDAHGMLKSRPGVFCCGEMLDWEAPTGGYLLTASMASGRAAGLGAWQLLQSL